MNRSITTTILVAATMSIAMIQEASAVPADVTARSVEPVVLLEGRRIAACGARATFSALDGIPAIEVRLERSGDTAALVILAEWQLLDGGRRAPLAGVSVDTASIRSADIMTTGPNDRDGVARLAGPATDARVTTFIQELMVSGAAVALERPGRETAKFRIDGPLPQSTRAAYLNCAGDLYRPEE